MAVALLVIDSEEISRKGLISLLRSEPDFAILGEAITLEHASPYCDSRRPPDVIVLCSEPDGHQLTGLPDFRRKHPAPGVLVLAPKLGQQQAISALKAGARGFMTTDVDAKTLFAAIRSVARGEVALSRATMLHVVDFFSLPSGTVNGPVPEINSVRSKGKLTNREAEVLALVSQGASNREIAEVLVISEHTVRAHLRNILDKLGLKNRIQAATWAARLGLDRSSPAEIAGTGREAV